MSDIEQRLEALEKGAVDDRMVSSLDRLADDTVGLGAILSRVDEQQQRLAKLRRDLERMNKSKASYDELDVRAAETRDERRRSVRKTYLAVAGALITAVILVVGGAWLTDAHLQSCLVNGPSTPSDAQLCDNAFPGHTHSSQESVRQLLIDRTNQNRDACARFNEVFTKGAEREEALALSDGTANAAVHAKSAVDLRAAVVDCAEEFPFPGQAS